MVAAPSQERFGSGSDTRPGLVTPVRVASDGSVTPLSGAGGGSGHGARTNGRVSWAEGAGARGSGTWEVLLQRNESSGGIGIETAQEARSLLVSASSLPRARAFLAGMRELAALFGYPFASVDGWWIRERERAERAGLFRRLCGDARLREGRVLTRWTEQALGQSRTCLFHDDQ